MKKNCFLFFVSILVLTGVGFNLGFAAEDAHESSHDTHGDAGHGGGGVHPHYSWLHPLSKIIPNEIIPEPLGWQQPDLILNAYFAVLVITILFFFGTRKLKRLPEGKGQTLLEMFVGGLISFFGGILGEHGKKYVPFVGSYFIFILFLNYLGLIPGFLSPTADLNTTVALGISALIGVHVIAIKENGLVGYLKHFVGDPWWLAPLMFPLHIIGEIARAGSLAIRLFGNIFGEESVIINLTILGLAVPLILGKIPWAPIQVPMLFFGLFGGFLQALVFSMLTSIYIVTFLEHHDEAHGAEAHH
jgi:F-type H+-transporting ATPase subunit a